MLQVKVFQLRTADNLLVFFWRASPSETSCDRSREFPDTLCSSGADGSRQTGGPFLLRNGVGTLRIAEDSRFSAFSLDAGCTRGSLSSSSSSETVVQI